ncbi:hypothetical protein GUITHDRAFT_151257 [Guillardia theta CCMP2712]|uniref:BHLH domain-containing protein n=1 Tax=Guillardia theta (strain CCMP2712) TaxID=905079 RepID=L1JP47_GUITC|nr:hypothetical protein GUITHDRAFT_151257 [Guillardia theta CCMP2712]EKX50232.1 hypothetical protein GUITHDRAFT_151257 [Guillardia theta CCMP2712]|mmetsp:Transcript_49027/g.153938  ORF Transcript_49027/g.153938 Transcript_49027/m.153938 type:complete len:317 (+) Transcript_49027:463-1413(+)|eukprot:XP_005837212.1 hypothetical protein GUITHDRAFT_151257 [Guillardia theta CCMP2712]
MSVAGLLRQQMRDSPYSHMAQDDDTYSVTSSRMDEEPGDKKVKHNKVEQKRRELTKQYVAELQEMLPNMEDNAPGAGINVVLEGVLDYLQSVDLNATKPRNSPDPNNMQRSMNSTQEENSIMVDASKLKAGRACVNLSHLRYLSAFDTAPFGIAIARADGRIMRVNGVFEKIMNFMPGKWRGETMFSLTAPSDLPYTMQAVGSLLNGSEGPVNLNKRCVRASGEEIDLNAQMTCLWRDKKPEYFLCYLRLHDPNDVHHMQLPPSSRVESVASSYMGSPAEQEVESPPDAETFHRSAGSTHMSMDWSSAGLNFPSST